MMTAEERAQMNELCIRIHKEQNPAKFLALIEELQQPLDKRQAPPRGIPYEAIPLSAETTQMDQSSHSDCKICSPNSEIRRFLRRGQVLCTQSTVVNSLCLFWKQTGYSGVRIRRFSGQMASSTTRP
jgi:hypothetical protein